MLTAKLKNVQNRAGRRFSYLCTYTYTTLTRHLHIHALTFTHSLHCTYTCTYTFVTLHLHIYLQIHYTALTYVLTNSLHCTYICTYKSITLHLHMYLQIHYTVHIHVLDILTYTYNIPCMYTTQHKILKFSQMASRHVMRTSNYIEIYI